MKAIEYSKDHRHIWKYVTGHGQFEFVRCENTDTKCPGRYTPLPIGTNFDQEGGKTMLTKSKTPVRPLPCGCIRGTFLCKEAERLWRASQSALESECWKEYREFIALYDAHFGQNA